MIRNALSNGWKLWKKHLGDSLAYILIVTAITLMPFVPVLCLVSKNPTIQLGALAGIPLFILLVLPMRRSAARVLRGVCRGECAMNDMELISGKDFGARLLHGLRMTLVLLLWALPGIAITVYAYVMYTGGTDAITIVMAISKLGSGDVIKGIELMLAIYAACWLPLAVGCMLHSGARHAYASGNKQLLKGRLGGHCGVWCLSLVTTIPFILAVGIAAAVQLPPVFKLVKTFQLNAVMPALTTLGWELLAAFVVLLLPLIPLRHLMIAAYDHAVTEQNGESLEA